MLVETRGWAPTMREKLRATRKVWRCKAHVASMNQSCFGLGNCDECRRSEARRKLVVKWMQEHGLLHGAS